MKIAIRLLGQLSRRAATGALEIEIHDGATVAKVVQLLGLRPGEVWLVMRDAQPIDWDDPLQPGDELSLIPPVGGGS